MIFRFFDLDRNAPTLAAMYFAALFLILLFPFAVSSPYVTRDNSAAWSDGARGIAFGQSGLLIGAAPAAALHRRLTAGTGLTVELWLNTASIADDDQARIVTYSLNNWERNFTIDREEADIVLRLRTSRTYANGKPTFDVRGVLVPGKLQHVVVTYDFLEERVYVDGTPRAASALRQGNFATWDPSYYLAFGNEADGGKPWDGTLAYAAIYDRPLAADTVAARYRLKQDAPAEAGLLAAYDFTRGTAQGAGAIPDMPRLQKPARVASDSRLFFLYLDGTFHLTVTSAGDLIRNVILFLPFGVFGFLYAERRLRAAPLAILATFVAAAVASASFEVLQYYLSVRTSSILDLAMNAAGALLGAVGYRYWWLGSGMRRWVAEAAHQPLR
jgi:VanZ family protein